MKTVALILAILAWSLTAFAQGAVSPQDLALLEKLSHDSSFTPIYRETEKFLDTINIPKYQLFVAYLDKTPNTVKVFKRQSADWEGQYTLTWFTVDHGKAQIVEAYVGDSSGSDKLQYVHVYTPEQIAIGYFDDKQKFISKLDARILRSEEVYITYKMSPEDRLRRF